MDMLNLILLIIAVNSLVYVFSIKKFLQPLPTTSGGYAKPSHRAWYMAILIGMQTLCFIAILLVLQDQFTLNNVIDISILILATLFCFASLFWGWRRLKSGHNARKSIETIIRFHIAILLCASHSSDSRYRLFNDI